MRTMASLGRRAMRRGWIMSSRKSLVRVIIPDSHGNHLDTPAANAFIKDVGALNPDQIVLLGDHLDCGGTFNTHQRSYTNELTESYEDDVEACNSFFDDIQHAAPKCKEWHYLEGNHEAN